MFIVESFSDFVMTEANSANGNNLDGIIVSVVKPVGISSFGVVRRIRSACGIKRVGHAGTLDPFAEGVLVVGIGRQATKTLGSICDFDKEYIAYVQMGKTTDTGDPTGTVISESLVPLISRDEIKAVLAKFVGAIDQIPPIYSALKIDGQRLYKLARKGVEVERKARPVTIYEIELLELKETEFQFRVVCSKGTYIRVLAEDIGRALGTVAYLKRLVRTRVGKFHLSESEDLEKLTARLREARQQD